MTANVEGMINAAQQAFKNGNKAEARTLLERALEIEEFNEDAWLWLSAVVDTPEEQQTCLENVLVINPNNERAKKGLASLGAGPISVEPEPPTETSVQWAPDAPASPPLFTEEPPTASSSASSTFKGEDVSAEVYDDWVSGLGIGTDGPAPAPPPPKPAAEEENPLVNMGFDEEDFESELESMFGSDDDDDVYGYDDDDIAVDEPEMTSGPFGSAGLFEDMDEEEEEPAPIQSTSSASMMSPGAENLDFEDDEFAEEPARPQKKRTRQTSGMVEEEPELSDTLEPSDYFVFIPEEIKAAHLPGEDESYPMPAIIGLVVLGVLNVGALIFLVMRLVG